MKCLQLRFLGHSVVWCVQLVKCSLVKYRDNTEIHMQVCVCKYGRRKVVISFTRADASLFPYNSAQRCKT